MKERFRWLAAAIAAHPDRTVIGRTRLQKEILLLQHLGFPSDFLYMIHFYGPYSEGLNAEVRLLESLGLVREEPRQSQNGDPYYVLRASQDAVMPEITRFQPFIDRMQQAEIIVLELAATYDAFRSMGSDHHEALERLRRKKGSKCQGGNEEAALTLLTDLGLPTS
jgi:uncharacterized protein YwgA